MANQNDFLVYGWNAQQNGAVAGQTGYATPATIPASPNVSTAEQATSGAPYPAPGGGGVTEVLTNPGYASGNGTVLGQQTVTALATVGTGVAYQNPSGLACLVTIAAGTVTGVQVAPLVSGAAGTYVTVAAGDATVTVPGGGFIKVTFTGTPTWTWVTTN